MHSEVDSLDRIEIIRQLRVGDSTILVGINLLREGLDLPEVATISFWTRIRKAFLRDDAAYTKPIGRASRNVNGRVISTQMKKRNR